MSPPARTEIVIPRRERLNRFVHWKEPISSLIRRHIAEAVEAVLPFVPTVRDLGFAVDERLRAGY